ncbi:hypothetical protein SARC_12961 [Sphaeroforma arctica JP610]|uniref:Uncharacterized protein n=1 Tax=Sphaeroforma arctica JP610 TaxID=667725 RepID=A0A0L0FCK5_9EUKA|nr:hypothetical protein SARC_12961 [Sphaeroforma arctica JP610]KNC74495.1 hypothetical protein SARC_12961 [Sphaeroforma arctica JP610]|eukprot:XP_014148397.1 hypothetical protein SARC_12961 [Sphaeroforma arctica JP610]
MALIAIYIKHCERTGFKKTSKHRSRTIFSGMGSEIKGKQSLPGADIYSVNANHARKSSFRWTELIKFPTRPAIFRYTNKADGFLIVFGAIGSVSHGAIIPIWTILFGEMIDLFIDNPDQRSNVQSEVAKYIVVIVALGVLAMFTAYVQYATFHITSERQGRVIRTNFLRSILHKEQAFYETNLVGSLTLTLNMVDQIQDALGPKSSEILRYTSQAITAFAIALATNWKMALVTMSTLPFLILSLTFAKKAAVERAKVTSQTYRNAAIFADEIISGVRVVQTMPESLPMLEGRYNSGVNQVLSTGIRYAWIVGTASGVMFALIPLAFALGLWYGSRLVYNGEITGGAVVTVFAAVMLGKTALSFVHPGLLIWNDGCVAARTLFAMIDSEVFIDASSEEGLRPQTCTGEIEFEKVDFSYPTRPEIDALQNVSFTAKHSHIVALVGSSGSGKSSCVSLIQRLYDVKRGRILLDGIDIKDLNVAWLRDQIGIVSQEPILFNISVADNISFGRPVKDMDTIIAAAKESNAHEFITNLPEGYNTIVGERGGMLSGGQKQRIALARALIGDPRILLLDEATSALDNKSERVVQDALDKACSSRTTIVVAHRLTTIQNATTIIAMDRGTIIERGTHDELILESKSGSGLYFKLWHTQAAKIPVNTSVETAEVAELSSDTLTIESKEIVIPTDDKRENETLVEMNTEKKIEEKNSMLQLSSPAIKKHKTMFRVAMFSKPELNELILGSFSSAVYGAVYPVIGYVYSLLISSLTGPGDEQVLTDGDFYSLMFIVIAAVHGSSAFIKDVCFHRAGEKLTHRLRTTVFASIIRKDPMFFDREENSSGVLTRKLAVDCQLVQSLFTKQLGSLCAMVGVIISGATISFTQSWRLALVLYCTLPFFVMAGILNYKVGSQGARAGKAGRARADGRATEFISNARTVTMLGVQETCTTIYDHDWTASIQGSTKRAHWSGLAAGFVDFLLFMLYAIGFAYGSYLYSIYQISLQELLVCFQGLLFTAILIQQAVPTIADTSKAKIASKSITRLLDDTPIINRTIDEPTDKLDTSKVIGNIALNSVHFAYPHRLDSPVLKYLSIHISHGETVALVGCSGCGKSTTLQLIGRNYDPHQGAVTLDNRDVRSMPVSHLRKLIGVVGQEPVLFNLTIAENIAFGLNITEECVQAAAQLANAHDFITEQPDGYNTVVGERGGKLSGGQKQRIAIARALVRDPKILLLDEATSALDTESERAVQFALNAASKGRTTIIVAHRLSTIKNADKIVVLNDGGVAEIGTHTELLRLANGEYTELMRTVDASI